ncbi:hypothetical protein BXZ70DRAFT_1008774 [Cristinia sonorae]|uniref:BTB domain-containing protein n=1 Tax=Cristinia sonorae TaxID=1940300 RepID=A0A8K0UP89_9AGAR|nr:hypothetical protein BXZ70DRAFT_1008774 [Cristinia sonorae]
MDNASGQPPRASILGPYNHVSCSPWRAPSSLGRRTFSVFHRLLSSTSTMSSSSVPESAFERGDPWMEDGSIVLKAGNTCFRVHRTVLARNAEVFADMFDMPQPDPKTVDDGQVMIEGCIVVELLDHPTELGHFLRACYDGWSYFQRNSILPVEVVIAFIRLGTKYQALHLREEGVLRLPGLVHSLSQHEEASDAYSRSRQRRDLNKLANLVLTHDLAGFLPQVLYACLQVSDDLIQDSETPQSSASSDDDYSTGLEPPEELLPMNIQHILSVKPHLIAHTEQIISNLPITLGRTKMCTRNRLPGSELCWSILPPSTPLCTPERWLDAWLAGVEKAARAKCPTMCMMNARVFHRKKLEEFRRKLPQYFGLAD